MSDKRYAEPPTDGLKIGDYYTKRTFKPGNQRSNTVYVWNGSEWEASARRGDGRELYQEFRNAESGSNEYVKVPQGYDGAYYWALKDGGAGIDRNMEFIIARDEKLTKDRYDKVMTRLQKFEGPGENYATEGIRKYPSGTTIGKDSDYVLFQFKRYAPPFRKVDMFSYNRGNKGYGRLNLNKDKRVEDDLSAWARGAYDYNQATAYEDAGEQFPSIIMYMPEDISTGFRGNWGGKAFSTVGAGILGAAGQAGLDKLGGGFGVIGKSAERALGLASAKILQKAVQKVGGDTLTNDDVFGSVSGSIMNPNTELLFQSVDMRNFMLKFKLVPRSPKDTVEINAIIKIFKACTLPMRNPNQVMSQNDPSKPVNNGILDAFIGVPNLCRVSFMRGPEEHKVLPRYKMLAVTQVDVNYTPDGAYATYDDAQPVAIELSINFQETKINFAEEILEGYIR